jgi:pimeloyl-ACP methyl ester carboxylesterase
VTIDLYLLPGLDGTGELFKPFVEVAPDWVNPIVVRYDPSAPQSYSELAAEVSAQIDRRRRFLLLGESFSGPVAILAAASNERNLAGVILCATFATNPLLSLAHAPDFLVGLAVKFARRSRILDPIFGFTASAEIEQLAAHAIASVSDDVFIRRTCEIRDIDVTSELSRLACPVLYLKAMRDRLIPSRAHARILRARPETATASIDSTHLLLQTCPHEAWAAIGQFAGSADTRDDC